MGLSNNITNNAVPEWKDFYVDYDRLRTKIRHKDFKGMLNGELAKINNFYFLLEKKAVDEKNKIFDDIFTELPEENFEDLRAQTENTSEESGGRNRSEKNRHYSEIEQEDECRGNASINIDDDGMSSESSYPSRKRRRDMESGLRRFMKIPRGLSRRKKEKNITEFLHSLVKITAYRDMNASAMLRLAKKYDDTRRSSIFYEDFSRKLKNSYFYKSNRIDLIRMAIKRLYRRIFAKNQPEKARAVFSRIKRGLKSSEWLFIISGLLIGVSITLALLLRNPESKSNFLLWALINIYIGFILFGFCLKIFKGSHINYKFIFNFDVCSSMNNSLYLLLVSSLLFFHVVGFIAIEGLINRLSYSLVDYIKQGLIAGQTVVLLLPFDLLFYNSRLYLLSVFGHAIFKPFSVIRFRHFYFIDVAQSFSFSFKTLLIACGVTNNAILCSVILLFPTIRILQCLKRYSVSKLAFPHVLNCGKFTLGILFNLSKTAEKTDKAFIGYSILFGVLNSLAGFFWDFFMDWHIMRSRYLYPQMVYYVIIGFNFITRLLWTGKYMFKMEYPVVEGILEIIRRFLWTLIRVEVEHLNNCDELKTRSVINLTGGEL
ncbi:xenotropic and polytropic retrovirus receptor 1, partial [Pancytospora epiphaga]